MPLKPAVEAEIKKLAANNADEVKRLTEIYEKYPQLQEAFLADADYQRNVQATAAARKAAEAAEAAAKEREQKNLKWWNETSAAMAAMENENKQMKDRLVDLEAGKTDLEDAGATPAQLKKYDTLIAELQKKIDANEQFVGQFRSEDGKPRQFVDAEQLNKSADGFGQFLMDSVDILRQHDRKFADMPLSSRDLYKFMTENKMDSVQSAYDKMTAERRQKDWETKREKEIEMELRSKMKLPIDTGATAPAAEGALLQFLNKKQPTPDIPADGSGRLAAAAAAEMRAEGKV